MNKKISDSQEIHSEDMQDIIEKPPRWIEKRGNSVVFFILAAIILFTMLIKYPESIQTNLMIQSKETSKIVVSPIDGFIYKISVKNGMKVKKGEVLVYLTKVEENTMILELYSILNEVKNAKQKSFQDAQLRKLHNIDPTMLGSLELSFRYFLNSYLFNADSPKFNTTASIQKKSLDLAIDTLLNKIDQHEQGKIVRSPMSGIVEISGDLAESRKVMTKEKLIQVKPNEDSYYGEMEVPQNNMGKVSIGQDVRINMESYPYLEYGTIGGKIISIEFTPTASGNYLSRVELVRSSTDSLIKFKPGMRGKADIIIQEQTAFKRIWLNALKFLK